MKNKGITLISLVITIIILIILAGIAINLSIGKNGIFNRAKQAKEQYAGASAKEKLETVLMEAVIEKEINPLYTNQEFLNNMLEEKGMEVNGDTVIVDNYTFIIDREKLKIQKEQGELNIKITKQVKSYLGKNAEGKYEVEILLIVESNEKIKTITIENPDGTTLKLETDKIQLGKDLTIELDKEYKVIITTNEGKEETRRIIEKSEETIRTAQELAEFRDKVNSGLTYEGKTIKLGNDIDLSSVCGKNVNGKEISWEPIGSLEADYFEGTFEGNYKTISNLYININTPNDSGKDTIEIGLFSGLGTGIIQNLIIENAYIYYNSDIINKLTNWQYVGIIAGGTGLGTIRNCGINSGEIRGIFSSQSTNVVGFYLGGISGCNGGKIQNCYNKATVYGEANNNNNKIFHIGGISGDTEWGGEINNCYNVGEIIISKSGNNLVLCGGVLGELSQSNSVIKNSYNIKEITVLEGLNVKYSGGIIGRVLNNALVENSYCSDNFSVSYYNSTTKKTDGIVDSQTLKNSVSDLNLNNEEDVWIDDIGINNGYPILKWQAKRQ